MPTTPETLSFQAEVPELLDLMIHSLYSHREIFLRELISNASDALDRLRFEALSNEDLAGDAERLAIRLEVEPVGRILRVIDNGIGMSREELVENLSTIARSGTRRFLDAAREDEEGGAPALIGQFGVGFYSAFMVASEIVVETRRAGADAGWRWRSKGDGEFTLEEAEGLTHGTRIELRLRPKGEDEDDFQDFTDTGLLRGLVRRYSDFVEWPIEMAAALIEHGDDLPKESAWDGVEVVVLNSRKPLWARPKDEISDEDYAQFYKHVAHAWTDPLDTIHLKAEGTTEYTALLFLPAERTPDLFDPQRVGKSRVSLYVRRVFVMADCEDLLPTWLRFVRGIVDSQDLPLNVSREILQQNRVLGQIRKRLVKKVLDSLGTMLADRRDDYVTFWRAFGPVLKEGLVMDEENREAIAEVCLFETSHSEEPATLAEYVGRMKADQTEIFCLPAADREAAERSPHMESLRERGLEVLYLVDAVDEWVLERMTEHDGKPLRAIDKGAAVDAAAQEEVEAKEREMRSLLETLEGKLEGKVESVRFSTRLVDSAAVLVDSENSLGPQMEHLLRQSGQEPPPRKRVLELNPGHPVLERLRGLHEADPGSDRLADFTDLLYGQALLSEGSRRCRTRCASASWCPT